MKFNTKLTIRFFAKHVRRYKVLAIILFITVVFATATEMIVPYFYKRFFDTLSVGSAFPEQVFGKLIFIIFIIAGVNMASWLCWRIFNFSASYFESWIMANISNECFQYLHGHSYNFFNNNFTGSLVKRVNRLVRSFEGLADRFYFDLTTLALKVLIIFGVLFWLHPWIGMAMMIWTLIFLFFNYAFTLYKLKYDRARAKSDTRVSAALADTITNSANIKLFSALQYELNRFKAITNKWCRQTILTWNLSQIADAVQTFLMIFLEFAILYFAIRFWRQGLLTIGDFVWIQAYLIELFGKLWMFGRTIRNIYGYFADSEEMIVILNKKHDVRDFPGAKPIKITHGRIEFRSVCFSYRGQGLSVINDLNLNIKPGEKAALIGPSGGGKSTVAKLLLRLFDIKTGKILVDGQNISHVTQNSLREQIAFVPQDPILFHRTLLENIRYGRRNASSEEITAASKLAHCHDFIAKLPHEYETYVGERGVKLSGGERQRVAIARAILANAPILILDEATSSLDSESEMLIQEALANLMKQKTTIVIAHRLSTIMKMDRIVVLQDGKIVEEGTHSDLVSKESGLYKKLWDLQVGGYVGE